MSLDQFDSDNIPPALNQPGDVDPNTGDVNSDRIVERMLGQGAGVFDKAWVRRPPKPHGAQSGQPDFTQFGKTQDELDATPAPDFTQFGEEAPAENKDESIGFTGNVKAAAKGAAQGAISGVGSALQGAALAQGTQKPSESVSLNEQAMNSGVPVDIPPEADQPIKPEETGLYKAGARTKKFAQEAIPMSQAERESLGGEIGSAVGGGAAGMGAGLAAGMLGGPLAGMAAGAGVFAAQSAGDTFEAAKAKGASDETALQAAGLSGAVGGALGVLPVGALLSPIKRFGPGLTGWALGKLAQFGANGGVFTGVGEAQQWINSEIAKAYYDPNAKYDPSLKRAMGEFIAGGAFGVMHPLGGADQQQQAQPQAQPQPNAGSLPGSGPGSAGAGAQSGAGPRPGQGGGGAGAQAGGRPTGNPNARDGYDNNYDWTSPSGATGSGTWFRDDAQGNRWYYNPGSGQWEQPSAQQGGQQQSGAQGRAQQRQGGAGAPPASRGAQWSQFWSQTAAPGQGEQARKSWQTLADVMRNGYGFATDDLRNASIDDLKHFAAAADMLQADGYARADIAKMTPDQMRDALDGATTGKPSNQAEPGMRDNPINLQTTDDLRRAEQVVNTDHSHAQGEAGNIQRGHVVWNGLGAKIEVPAGGTRRGTTPEGGTWESTHPHAYGEFNDLPAAADGMKPDVIFGEHPNSPTVYVIDEVDPETGKYRQSKTFVGFRTPADVAHSYAGISSKSFAGIGGMRAFGRDEFVKFAKDGGLSKPVTDLNSASQQKRGGEEKSQPAGMAADTPSAEPLSDIAAQRRDLDDPQNARNAVWLPAATVNHLSKLGKLSEVISHYPAVHDFDRRGGILIAKTLKVARVAKEERNAGRPIQSIIGRFTGAGTGKPADATHVVQQIDERGNVTRERAVAEKDIDKARAALSKSGRTVRVVTPEEAIARRAELVRKEAGPAQAGPVGHDEHIEVAQAIAEAGIDPATVRPADIARAAEIAAHEGLEPHEAFPVAVLRSLVEDGHISPEAVRQVLGNERANAVLEPGIRDGAQRRPRLEASGAAARGQAAAAANGEPARGAAHGEGDDASLQVQAGGEAEAQRHPLRAGTEADGGVGSVPAAGHQERGRDELHATGGEHDAESERESGQVGERPGAGSEAAVGKGAPSAKGVRRYNKPLSLLEFIGKRGGLRPSPEWDGMGLNYRSRVIVPVQGYRNLIRRDGMSMDGLIENLREGGYIERAPDDRPEDVGVINHVYDLIDSELRGTKQYPLGSEAPQRVYDGPQAEFEQEIEEQREKLHSALDEAGIPLHSLTPEMEERTVRLMHEKAIQGELFDPLDLMEAAAMSLDRDRDMMTEAEIRDDGRVGEEVFHALDEIAAPQAVGNTAQEGGESGAGLGLQQETGSPGAGEAPRGNGEGAGSAPEAAATERTEAGEQHVLPGTEHISDAEQAQRGADEKLKPKKPQKAADEGLFGDAAAQTDLVDMARKPKAEGLAGELQGDKSAAETFRKVMESGQPKEVADLLQRADEQFRKSADEGAGDGIVGRVKRLLRTLQHGKSGYTDLEAALTHLRGTLDYNEKIESEAPSDEAVSRIMEALRENGWGTVPGSEFDLDPEAEAVQAAAHALDEHGDLGAALEIAEDDLREHGFSNEAEEEGAAKPAAGPTEINGVKLDEDGNPTDPVDAALSDVARGKAIKSKETRKALIDGGFAQGAKLALTDKGTGPADSGTKEPNRLVISTGVRLRTKSGRITAPAPRIEAASERKTISTLARMNGWLLDEAKKEADAEGNDFVRRQLDAINIKNLSQSDQDEINLVLFGDSMGATEANVVKEGEGESEAEKLPAKIGVGTKWTDSKGREWEVYERLPFGKFKVRTTDKSRLGELKTNDIRAAIEEAVRREAETAKNPGPVITGDLFGDDEPVEQKPRESENVGMLEAAGEKIGGARKDKWIGRGLDLSDLEGMTGAEKATHVTKANVWARPDYAQAVEEGVDPKAAAIIKLMYDRLPAKWHIPEYSGWDEAKAQQNYILSVRALRDALAEVKTTDDIGNAREAFKAALEDHDSQGRGANVWRALARPGSRGWGNPFDKLWEDGRKAEKMVAAGFPEMEPWRRLYTVRGRSKWDEANKRFIDNAEFVAERKNGDAVGVFKTREEAEAAAKKAYEENKGKVEEGNELPKRPHLDRVDRVGPDYREGKNVDAKDFMDTFGFRGVEFGNYVASDERQRNVNMAYDALMDLARVTGLPPKALSLDGRLAIAFGARGHGGHAAAHYEPGRVVINLTKMSGAGTQAHEWTHALDHYLGELDRENAYGGAPKMASLGRSKINDLTFSTTYNPPNTHFRSERLRDAVNRLMHALHYRQETVAEAEKRLAVEIANVENSIESWKKFAESARKHLTKKERTRYWNAQLKKSEEALGYLDRKRKAISSAIENGTGRKQIETSYFTNAKKLGDYWSRPEEMLARAFESYVFDKIDREGNKSQYLVHSVEPNRFGNAFRGNPFPTGDERAVVNAHFDHLFRAIEAGEGKLGKGTKIQGRAGKPDPVEVAAPVRTPTPGADFVDEQKDFDEAQTAAANSNLPDAFAQHFTDGKGFANILAARKFAQELGLSDDPKVIEEALEQGIVRTALGIVEVGGPAQDIYKALVNLYGLQPKLGTRTSTSVREQAYSTPVPLAFLASRFAGITHDTKVFEPTAGNGALLIEADPHFTIANEINPARNKALKDQGFAVVLKSDASESGIVNPKTMDIVIANPPFGPVKDDKGVSKVFDMGSIQPNYRTHEIDHAIALKALEGMRDDGRGVLILGGLNKLLTSREARSNGYQAKAKREFYKVLYDNYNVVDHFTVSGDLYERQGAGWPVDVIVIHGRGKSARPLPAVDVPRIFNSWDALEGLLDGLQPYTRNAGVAGASDDHSPLGGAEGAAAGADVGGGGTVGGQRQPGGRSEHGEPGDVQPRPVSDGGSGAAGGERDLDQSEPGGRGVAGGSGAAASPERRPSGLEAEPPKDEFDEAFDDAFNDLYGKPQTATGGGGSRGGGGGGSRRTKSAQDDELEPRRNRKQSGAGEAAGDAAKKAAEAADEAFTALYKLFGGDKASSGFTFDPETYAKAKPHFEKAAHKFADSWGDLKQFVRLMMGHMRDALRWPGELVETIKPYLRRFVEEVRQGIIKLGTQAEEDRATGPQEQGKRSAPKQEQETESQVAYRPKSEVTGLGTLVPVNMRNSIAESLRALEKRVGNVDDFVASELGYDKADLEKYFGAEQVDALALAIDNLKRSKGFIIGDQTGIGKGRVNAAIIRWAIKSGRVPVFVTEKPNLYADMYRDLHDIGISDGFLDGEPRILATNAGLKLPLDQAGKVKIATGDSRAHNALLGRLSDPDELRKHYDMVFTNYSQMQTLKGEDTARRQFLQRLANSADGIVLIFDESHNAGGQKLARQSSDAPANRSQFARQMVESAKGVFYSSATYAKRPDVMDLYAATDMAMAVDDIAKLGEAIAKGGVPMQQAVAAMLAKAGQYIRRERSFAGVTYDTPLVSVPRQTYDQISQSLALVQEFSAAMKDAVAQINDDIRAEGEAVGYDNSVGQAGASSTNFTAVMHNLINQMLLSMKARPAAEMAIESLKRGEKVVLTVANTMESFLTDYANEIGITAGEEMPADFSDVLMKYLKRTRTVLIKKPFAKKGETERKYLTDKELGPIALQAFRNAADVISRLELSDLPMSPIDFIKNELERQGYKVGEITGRGTIIDYSGDVPVLRTRPGSEMSIRGRKKANDDYNDGALDAIILNQAGSTGISLHASEKFKDQRQRHMIIVQPEANIDTHMQMLGRVHRTGQIVVPRYSQLVADIPAEKRPAAVLAKKMASLNANTTASRGGALTAKDVPDFINEYGDAVAVAYVTDNPEVNHRLADAVKFTENGYERTDAMRKLTGRIPLLPLKDQEELYEHLESEYAALLAQMEAAGENALEAKTLDLKAIPLEMTEVVKQKNESGSPFAEPVYVIKASVARLGKPYTPNEVMARVAKALGMDEEGRLSDEALFRRAMNDYGIHVPAEKAMRDPMGTLGADKARRVLDRVEAIKREQANRKPISEMTLDDLGQMLADLQHVGSAAGKSAFDRAAMTRDAMLLEYGQYTRDIVDGIPEPDKQEKERNKLNAIKDRWTDIINTLTVGKRIYLKTNGGNLTAIVLGIDKKGEPKNPLALGTWKVHFAIADASRTLTLPFSRLYPDQKSPKDDPLAIEMAEIENWIENPKGTLERFAHMQSEAREERYIATGNLLAAYDWLGNKGRIVNYTDAKGRILQGILPARGFKLDKHVSEKGRIVTDPNEIKTWLDQNFDKTLFAQDNIVRLKKNYSGYTILTEKAKRVGGAYYLDKALTALTGDFYSSGGAMQAVVQDRNIVPAIRRIMDLGAKFTAAAEKPKTVKIEQPPEDEGPVAAMAMPKVPPFYSAVLRAVEGAKQEKAAPNQWLGILKNTPGVKAEELQWLDLESWLKEHKGAVTKADLADYVRANQIDVREVERGGAGSLSENLDDWEQSEPTAPDEATVESTTWLTQPGQQDGGTGIMAVHNSFGEAIRYETWVNGEHLANEREFGTAVRALADQIKAGATPTKYGSYTLPGGENYRELLLTMPWKQTPAAGARWDLTKAGWVAYDAEGRDLTPGAWETKEEAIRMSQSVTAQSRRGNAFTSNHWEEPNVLAHVRFNERTIDGKKTLFLEELQSDWHQKGRKQGYQGDQKKKIEELGAKVAESNGRLYDEYNAEPANAYTLVDYGTGAEIDPKSRPGLVEAWQSYKDALFALNSYRAEGPSGVPEAPFKTTWPELVIKRMIRYAAEHGYDQIAWAPGEVQADRYNLSKHVSSVAYNRGAQGGILQVLDHSKKIVANPAIARDEELAEHIGKEVAERLLNKPTRIIEDRFGKWHVLEGLDLKVGGEAMLKWYDDYLPNVVNKLVKKYGTRVGQGALSMGPKYSVEKSGSKYIVSGGDSGNYGIFDSLEDANAQLAKLEANDREYAKPVHTLPITPALRDATLNQGFPMFTRPAQQPSRGLTDEAESRRLVLTPSFRAKRAQIEAHIQRVVDHVLGPGKVKVQFPDEIVAKPGTAMGWGDDITTKLAGSYNPLLNILRVAMGDGFENVDHAAFHEVWHALEDHGLDARQMALMNHELPRLTKAAERVAGSVYGMSPEDVAKLAPYEIRAIAWQGYATERARNERAGAGLHIGIRAIFEKIWQLLRRIANAIRGLGFQTFEGLFKQAYEGDFADRASRKPKEGSRLAHEIVAEQQREAAARGFGDRARDFAADEAGSISIPPQVGRAYAAMRDKVADILGSETAIAATERLSDYSHRMRLLQNDVEALWRRWVDPNGELPDEQTFYELKRLFPGKRANKVMEFDKQHYEPLAKFLRASGITRDEADEYLYARHAIERNAKLGQLYERAHPFNEALRDSSIAGASGMSADEARRIRTQYENGPKAAAFTELVRRVREINRFIQSEMLRGGLESQQTLSGWNRDYADYVPLQGWEDPEEAPDHVDKPTRTRGGSDVRGKEVQHAFGRTTKADSPLANLIGQAYRTIDRVEKNRVLVSMASALSQLSHAMRQGGSNATLAKELGVRLNKGRPTKTIIDDVDPVTGQPVKRIVTIDSAADQFGDKAVRFKIAGMSRFMVFDDPDLARAARTWSADTLKYGLGYVQWITNKMKSLWTHYSPTFLARHNARYFVEGLLNGFELKESGAHSVLQYTKEGFPIVGQAARAIFARERGEPAGELGRSWDLLKKHGGNLSLMSMRDIDELKESLRVKTSDLKRDTYNPLRMWHEITGRMNKITSVWDNAQRLASFHQAIKQGMSPQEAAVKWGRDATVDYNLRGLWSNVLGLMEPFFNTALRTGLRLYSAQARSGVMRKVFAATVAMGLVTSAWNYLVGGNDKDGVPFFDKLPEWERANSLILMNPFVTDEKGRPTAIKFPFPYNWAAPLSTGYFAGNLLWGHEKMGALVNLVFKPWLATISQIGEDGVGVQTFIPQVVRPAYDLRVNQTWTGAPIHQDPAFQKQPNAWSGRRPIGGKVRTGEGWQEIAKFLNGVSGGDRAHSGYLDFYPEDIRYVFNSFFGAQDTLVQNTYDTGKSIIWDHEAPKSTTVPVARVFEGQDYDAHDRVERAKRAHHMKRPWERE